MRTRLHTRSSDSARTARAAAQWVGGAVVAFALLVIATTPSSAEVLDFEGQVPGVQTSSVIEGSYEFYIPSSGGTEPGGLTCTIKVCRPGDGVFIANSAGHISFERLDGEAFSVESIYMSKPGGGAFQVTVSGIRAEDGSTVSMRIPVPIDWATYSMPVGFENIVSFALAVPGQAVAVDNIVVGPPMAGTPDAMTLLADDRSVRAFGENCYEDAFGAIVCDPYEDQYVTPLAPYASFGSSVAAGQGGYASQTSLVGTGSLLGSGSAGGWSDVGYGIGWSTYDVRFHLDQTTTIQLSGSLDMLDLVGFGYAQTTVELSEDAGPVLYQAFVDPYNGPLTFDYEVVLPAGDYRLVAFANGDVWIDTSFDFVMTASALPQAVPGLGAFASVVLAMALVGTGVSRRRRATGRLRGEGAAG